MALMENIIKIYFSFVLILITSESVVVSQETSNVGEVSPAATTTATTPTVVGTVVYPTNDAPKTLPDFIITMMKRYGGAKAAEAFQSLDQLPLGLIMKVLLVEMDKTLASDIVEMQRYAQSADKSLIMMIGRIVAGDKNVPKEIFAMDQKLMKFPWWMRIRQRMFNNLEKYIAAYSLVPVAAKAAINGGNSGKSSKVFETPAVDLPKSDLAAAVAASATEPSKQEQLELVAAASSSTATQSVESPHLRLSLLTPIQQQQILASLALNAQTQELQQRQTTNFNPLSFV